MRPVNTKAMWIMAGLLLLCSISGGSAQSMSDKGDIREEGVLEG